MAGVNPWSKAFFLGLPARLRSLSPESKPLWGNMSAQQMVEHLVGSWRISNGRAKAVPMLSEAETKTRRDFLFSDKPYEKHVANPIFAKGLPPLRKPSLAAAIDQLEDEMDAFFTYHELHPNAIEVHPVYGALDREAWLNFQTKHMQHHLAQFGLM